MNVKQLNSIAYFYNQLLIQVRQLKFSERRKKEEEKKALLVQWLLKEKKLKTFGEVCRHEIAYMILEVEGCSLLEFESKIENLDNNCGAIRMEMEMNQGLIWDTTQKSRYG